MIFYTKEELDQLERTIEAVRQRFVGEIATPQTIQRMRAMVHQQLADTLASSPSDYSVSVEQDPADPCTYHFVVVR